ncbi:MAG TPA: response regulator [Candidatus Krumholzibacteria bacterium]|nr:response regulator [Candidatus Krumholzibacteria bacterium]
MNQRRILVVDDDQDLLMGLGMRLRAQGYDVITAADSYTALATARKERPDLMILDLGLPAGEGFLVMERMQSIGELANLPVIVLSARDPIGNRDRAHRLGARAYFKKPADNTRLLEAIDDALGAVV